MLKIWLEICKKKIANGGKANKQETVNWQKALNQKGWFAPGWPKEYGGGELSVIQKYILAQELSLANTPNIVPFGVTMIGPVLIEYGTKEQQQKYLPNILNSDHWWCQGYSEPGSGSDLASLKTKAIKIMINILLMELKLGLP